MVARSRYRAARLVYNYTCLLLFPCAFVLKEKKNTLSRAVPTPTPLAGPSGSFQNEGCIVSGLPVPASGGSGEGEDTT